MEGKQLQESVRRCKMVSLKAGMEVDQFEVFLGNAGVVVVKMQLQDGINGHLSL